jgi:hypothetical protein
MTSARTKAPSSANFSVALMLEALGLDQRIEQITQQYQRQHSGEDIGNVQEPSPSRSTASTSPNDARNTPRSSTRYTASIKVNSVETPEIASKIGQYLRI